MGITWGGRWDTPDRSHFEVTNDWKEKRETEMEKRYETLAEVPTWAKELVQELVARGCFADPNRLHLSEDMLRTMALTDRLLKAREGRK